MKLRRRGSATVELALLTIVIIPTLLYTFYLEDLLFYKFDLEETVVSTPFDFATHDYRKKSASEHAGTVRQASMQTFWDHTSAWNSYENPNYDAKETVHHEAMTAHQCWLAKGGEEITCMLEKKETGLSVQPTFKDKNNGGLVSCKAKLGVQNYFLANKIFGGWGKVNIAGDRMKMHTAGQSAIHDEAHNDPYLYPQMHFGLVVDTWALYKTDEINPDSHNAEENTQFRNFVDIPYGLRRQLVNPAIQFGQKLVSEQILSSAAMRDGSRGDKLETPPLAWKPDPQREFNGHYTSAWDDSRHSQTQGKLVEKYMGVEENSW